MSLTQIINTTVLDQGSMWAARYASAEPFEHVVIDNFFNNAVASALIDEFPTFERGNNLGDDGVPGKKSAFERIVSLGGAYQKLDQVVQSPEFLDFIATVTGVENPIYDPFYLGGGTHENRDGQTLDPHVDFNYHPSEGWHRRLNLIVYLNPDWQSEWGGNLQLFADPRAQSKPNVSITPIFNRCVIFGTTERSWHGFDRIQLPEQQSTRSRKSIALYFYSKTRPAAETAGKHTTVYINQQLPDSFREGHTLTASDVALARELISRRDDHLQRIYEENAALRQAYDRGFSGKLLYLLRRFYVRFRR